VESRTAPVASNGRADASGISPRHPAELPLFAACLVVCLPAYAAAAVALALVILPLASVALIPLAIVLLVGWFIGLALRAAFVARIRGNGLMVGPDQLPAVHEAVARAAAALRCKTPEAYVVQYGGLREAVTKLFLGSRLLVLSSRLVDDHGGGAELKMMVGRELGRLRSRHLTWRFWLFPSMVLPFLYPAWRRATEYTADRCGLLACGDPQAAERAIYISAAGARMGRDVRPESYRKQIARSGGFWMTLSHLLASEPCLAWRASQLLRAMSQEPGRVPAPRRSILATILCVFVPGTAALRGGAGAAIGPVLLLLVVVLLMGAGASLMLFGVEAPLERLTGKTTVKRDMADLSRAAILYAHREGGGRLPASGGALAPYVSPGALRSLRDGEIIYVIEDLRRGGPLTGRTPPHVDSLEPQTILFYCPDPRSGEVIVACADGSVHATSPGECERGVRRLRARLGHSMARGGLDVRQPADVSEIRSPRAADRTRGGHIISPGGTERPRAHDRPTGRDTSPVAPAPRPRPPAAPTAPSPPKREPTLRVVWDLANWSDARKVRISSVLKKMCIELRTRSIQRQQCLAGVGIGPPAGNMRDVAYVDYKRTIETAFTDALIKDVRKHAVRRLSQTLDGVPYDRVIAFKGRLMATTFCAVQDGRCLCYWYYGPMGGFQSFRQEALGKARVIGPE